MWMRKFRRRMWIFRRGVGPPTSPRPNGRSYQGGRMGALDGRIKEGGGGIGRGRMEWNGMESNILYIYDLI
jgi:hypothetical protein